MWAQLVKMRVPESKRQGLISLDDRWAREVGGRPGTGWKRSYLLQNQDSANEYFVLVVFDSEEQARANEQTPEHLALIDEMMATVEGQPEFVNLIRIAEHVA